MSGEGWFLDAPIYAQVDRDGDGVFELEYRYLQSAVSGDIVGFLPSSGPGSRLEYSMFGVPRYAAGARGNFGADVDDGTGTGTPDGGVDINDLTYFLALYDAGDERVDLDNGSGLGLPDGGTDVNDLLYFLTLYEAGARGGDLADLRFAWRGYVWDAHLQLYHVRHRAFDPKLMAWLQPDPLGDVDGPNPYAYVGWDPFGKMDPYGLADLTWKEFIKDYLFSSGDQGRATRAAFREGARDGIVIVGNQVTFKVFTSLDRESRRLRNENGWEYEASDWAGVVAREAILAAVFVGAAGTQEVSRFFYDPRTFGTISREYWSEGPAAGRSLHHWLIPQRATWVPQGIRNAGFNLVELPGLRGVFHPSLNLNTWMGFASRWGGTHATKAFMVEWGIRLSIPGSLVGGGYAGCWIEDELFN